MARGQYTVNFEDAASGTSKKTLVQLLTASTGSRVAIKEISVSGDSTSATAVPILIRLVAQSTAGTASAGTVNKMEAADGAANTTASVTYTVEPTDGAVVMEWRIPPTSGFVEQFPLGDEPVISTSSRMALTVTAAATVNLTGYIRFEE